MKKSGKAKKTAFCAMFAALAVAILAVGSLIDVLDLSLALLAGVVIMIVDLEFSESYAWSAFAVSALLSFLLPVRTASFLYALFFGWYPLFRKHIRTLSRWLRILIKIVLFTLLCAIALFASVCFVYLGCAVHAQDSDREIARTFFHLPRQFFQHGVACPARAEPRKRVFISNDRNLLHSKNLLPESLRINEKT